jgi:DNA-binding IclR family transcriptional regulator
MTTVAAVRGTFDVSSHAARNPPLLQSTHKALVLLKHVGMHHETGLRLTDLIELTGYDKSTVHRQLRALMDEGFVELVPATKLYRLGVESMQLGFASNNMAPLVDRFRPLMLRVARISEDTVFLVVRSGDWGVCVHREEGAYPVKVFSLGPGDRRLLGVSAVGLCILAQESDAAIASMHARHRRAYEAVGMPLERLLTAVRGVRRQGYSEIDSLMIDNTGGVGCAMRVSAATQVGVSIAAIGARMNDQRRRELGSQLVLELDRLRAQEGGEPVAVTSASAVGAPGTAAADRPLRAARPRPAGGPGTSN